MLYSLSKNYYKENKTIEGKRANHEDAVSNKVVSKTLCEEATFDQKLNDVKFYIKKYLEIFKNMKT